jgi:hypothetical protein
MMDVFGREPGRFLSRSWTSAVSVMVALRRADGRQNVHHFDVAIRKSRGQDRLMKKSNLLVAFTRELDKPPWNEAASRRMLARMADPAFGQKEIYAWLVTNHAEVEQLRARWDRPGWRSIAQIMAADDVIGARGAPPNENSVRRVWKRVCRDKAAREAREAAKTGEGPQGSAPR